MGNTTVAANWKLDGLQAALDRLKGPARESLARRSAVAGGRVLRDEAKLLARTTTEHVYNPESRGSHEAQTLADAIYLAYRDADSTATMFKYSVTWNAQQAWWGKLREFGYFIRYPYYKDGNGMYHTYHGKSSATPHKLSEPHYVPAEPFLAPAMGALPRVKAAMIESLRTEFPKLLRGEE